MTPEEYRLLLHIDSPEDLKRLSAEELRAYCDELRRYIVDECSVNPGHLASSLGAVELAAALLSGDETTFRLFRTQAPELVHLPDATYEWYCKNYLDRYYPVRFILHHQGIEFPQA